MIIYKYSFISGKIKIEAIECVERPKTYIYGQYHTCVRKETLNSLTSNYDETMYSLSNNCLEEYKQLLIKKRENKIARYQEHIDYSKEIINKVKNAVVVSN